MSGFEGFRETLANDAETIAAKFKARAITLRQCQTVEELVEVTTRIVQQEDQYSISKVRVQSMIKEGLDKSINDMKMLLEKADAANEATEKEFKKVTKKLHETEV